MNSTDIQNVLQISVPDKFGVAVLPCDWLSRITADQFAVVVNSDTAEKPGMHWLAIFKEKRKSGIEFFDSCSMPVNFYHPNIGSFLKKIEQMRYVQALEGSSQSSAIRVDISVYIICLIERLERDLKVYFKLLARVT